MKRRSRASAASAAVAAVAAAKTATPMPPTEKRRQEEDEESFWSLIERLGVIRRTSSADGRRFALRCEDPARFSAALSAELQQKATTRIAELFRAEVSDAAAFDAALCPLQLQQSGDDDGGGARLTTVAPSLTRLLLACAPLQSALLDVLFEQLLLAASPASGGEGVRAVGLIVSHLQWLPAARPDDFAARVLSVLGAVTVPAHKRELVLALPTIVDESQHTKVGEALLGMMGEMPSAALEALSHLTLPQSLADEVARRSLAALDSAEPRDIPALLSFVLGSATTEERAKDVAAKTRAAINLEHIAEQARKTRRGTLASSLSHSSLDERELLEVLRFGLRLNKHAALAFIASLAESAEAPPGSPPLRVFDLLLFLVLASVESWRKRVLALVDKGPQLFPDALVQYAFAAHAAAVHSLLPSGLLQVAECLVRTGSSPEAKAVGGSLYSAALSAFGDFHTTQGVLSLLATHMCPSSSRAEVSAALAVLESAAETMPRRLHQFAEQIKSLVDHVLKMSSQETARLYGVFARLCFFRPEGSSSGGGGEKFSVNEHFYGACSMLLQKQLGRLDLEYKRIGAIGTVVFIQRVASLAGNATEAAGLFDMGRTHCSSAPTVLGFFYDELEKALSANIQDIDPGFISTLQKYLPSEFQRNFLAHDLGVDEEDWHNLLEDKAPYSVAIFRMVNSNALRDHIQVLCPLFRLVALCEKAVSGSARSVDVLLCAPLAMFKQQQSQNAMSKRDGEAFCLSLFHGIQWIRELLNVFSDADGGEKSVQLLLKRLSNLCELEERFSGLYKTYATPKVPELRPQTIPLALPKRSFPQRKKPAGVPSQRPLERKTIISLLCMLTDNAKILHPEDSRKLRYLLAELQQDVIAACAKDARVLEAPVSLVASLLTMFSEALKKSEMFSSGDDSLPDGPKEDFYSCTVHCLNIIRQVVSCAVARRPAGFSETWPLALLRAATPPATPPEKACEDSMEAQMAASFSRFEQLSDSATSIGGAVGFLQILELLAGFARQRKSHLCSAAGGMLTKSWPKSQNEADYLRYMLEMFVMNSGNPLETMHSFSKREVARVIGRQADEESSSGGGGSDSTYSTLTKSTVPIFFRTLLRLLVGVHENGPQIAAPTHPERVLHERHSISLFVQLLNAATMSESFEPTKEMKADMLRYGSAFLVSLCKKMKFLTSVLPEFREKILKSIRKLQRGTRKLQYLCDESKRGPLARLVPAARKALESVIYNVKQMLAKYKLASEEYFSISPLVSKDLHGKKQSQEEDEEEEGEAEDEEEEEEEIATKTHKRRAVAATMDDEDEDEEEEEEDEDED